MQLLNCRVTEAQWRRWQQHLAPAAQPFFVPEDLLPLVRDLPRWTQREFYEMEYALSLKDTFALYHVSRDAPWVLLLDEQTFRALAPGAQDALLGTQRDLGRGAVFASADWASRLAPDDLAALRPSEGGLFVLWPSAWCALGEAGRVRLVESFVCADRLPHRGAELNEAHRALLDATLPGVLELAGTFAADSGANCLSTAVAAFGVPGVANVWLHGGPFERWLSEHGEPTDARDEPGTVLVWRDAQRRVQHAAVALGEGWALQKDAQGWFAPRQVIALPDLLARWHRETWTVEGWRVRAAEAERRAG